MGGTEKASPHTAIWLHLHTNVIAHSTASTFVCINFRPGNDYAQRGFWLALSSWISTYLRSTLSIRAQYGCRSTKTPAHQLYCLRLAFNNFRFSSPAANPRFRPTGRFCHPWADSLEKRKNFPRKNSKIKQKHGKTNALDENEPWRMERMENWWWKLLDVGGVSSPNDSVWYVVRAENEIDGSTHKCLQIDANARAHRHKITGNIHSSN